jgi:hypothetical protein
MPFLKKFIFLFVTVACQGIGYVRADAQQHKICIGQYKLNCPAGPVDGFYKCGTKQEDAAQDVCTIHQDGAAKKLGYSVIPVASTPAKQCNYNVFLVTCYGP